MDAASTYVFGHVLSKTVDGSPNDRDVAALLREAWSAKHQWAKQLIVPEGSLAEGVFKNQAEKNGLAFSAVPFAELLAMVAPLKESFSADF